MKIIPLLDVYFLIVVFPCFVLTKPMFTSFALKMLIKFHQNFFVCKLPNFIFYFVEFLK